MASKVGDPELARALSGLSASAAQAMALMPDATATPMSVADALALTREVEVVVRQAWALRLRALDMVERGGWHRPDGHASASVYLRHVGRTSTGDARSAAQAVRALRDLPLVAEGLAAGEFGAAHVGRVARLHANDRVRDELLDPAFGLDAKLARLAAIASYREFDLALSAWERLADEDGARDEAQRDHERRSLRIELGFGGGCRLEGGGGTVDGERLRTVVDAFARAEWEADWADARSRLGDVATVADLGRTDAQRAWDALMAMAEAAAEHGSARGGSKVETVIVMDHETFERELARLAGVEPDPIDPDDRDSLLDPCWLGPDADADACAADADADADGEVEGDGDGDGDGAVEDLADPAHGQATGGRSKVGRVPDENGGKARPRCSTLDGTPVDPTEAMANALFGYVRRAVVGADGVVIDMGRRRRLFTGPAQLAVRLSRAWCTWPGCWVSASQCQTDHLVAWKSDDGSPGGSTSPPNGGPACGRHNRFKQQGFTVRRDAHGGWHVHRPDGTEIE